MEYKLTMTFAVCVLFILATLCGSTSSFELDMMSEPEIRTRVKDGASDFNTIMNVILAGMPSDIIQKAKQEMAVKFGQTAQAPAVPINPLSKDSPVQLKRKKRSFDNSPFDFGFNTNSPGTNNAGEEHITYPGTSSSSSSSSSYSSSFDSDFSWGRRLVCPQQVDQGRVYNYGSNPNTYPAVEIGQELFVRSLPGSDLLFQSLSRSVVLPTDPPQIFMDEFLAKANTTCRTAEDQVWSYDSVTYTGRCYPLVNFQETPFFTTCLNRYCKNCRSSSYGFSYTANICVTEYDQVSLFSYCESLIPNRRIVFDRILVPISCTCTTVHCRDPWRRSWSHWKR